MTGGGGVGLCDGMIQTVRVELAERSYDILVGAGALQRLPDILLSLKDRPSCLVVTDETVERLHGTRLRALLDARGIRHAVAAVPSGEESKSTEQLLRLYSAALAIPLDRRGVVVAFGGGVVGDLAGYAAATYLRGVDLVQVPTTLLAMVDSAVGGKTGINLPEGKNLVGAFHQPRAVLCDVDLLATLPRREVAAGLAEVIKYGVIQDAALFALLEETIEAAVSGDAAVLTELVARSCAIKANVVGQDEREGGLRAILNFGHTLGHAIEKVAGYGRLLHGEAVGIGMVYAARLSCRALGLAEQDAERIAELVRRAGLPTAVKDLRWADLRRAMAVDKKGHAGVPRFVLAGKIGAVQYGCEVAEEWIEEVWRVLGE